jgi:hypothetical protein
MFGAGFGFGLGRLALQEAVRLDELLDEVVEVGRLVIVVEVGELDPGGRASRGGGVDEPVLGPGERGDQVGSPELRVNLALPFGRLARPGRRRWSAGLGFGFGLGFAAGFAGRLP